jgi:hypothetical protein
MLSESARMISVAEACFRVQAPNSKPRPWSFMVVIADADDCIEDMLLALRA